jgi:bifunctional DNase/RNase
MSVQMQLARIIITEISDSQIIFLKEVDGNREFPILIGIFEATSIDRRVKLENKPIRPLTHDLVVEVVRQMGGELESVVISELRDQMYFASLQIRRGEELIEIDSRPSDAIAIAVSYEPPLPIFVAEEVLEAASKERGMPD